MTAWTNQLSQLEATVAQAEADAKAFAQQADTLAPTLQALAAGEINATGSQAFSRGEASSPILMNAGEMLQLSILIRGNYGGDATSIEWVIEELGEKQRRWSAVEDLVSDLHQNGTGATHTDRYGHAKTWLMYDLDGGATLLDRFEPALFGTKGVPAWRHGDFPLVMVNTRDEPVKLQTITAPPKSLALHPGARAGVALAWRVPYSGAFRVHGRVQKIDPGGDGTLWRLEKRADISSFFEKAQALSHAVKQAVAARDAHLATKLPTKFAYAVSEAERVGNAKLLLRGDPTKPGAEVPRKNLDLFGGEQVQAGSGRHELATWLCRAEHPLTARVMVNRIWQGHFGRGIVATPNDFGTRGQAPTHPELLDWLASEFVRQGWSIKAMHRLIVTSDAYRQQCNAAASAYPQLRRRLDAEEIRDALLEAAGELDLTPGTTHPFKVASGYRYSQHNPFSDIYDTKKRSIYLITLRLRRHPMLGLFDGADPNATTPARPVSTVPTQAFYFLNDKLFHQCAASLARRVIDIGEHDRDCLNRACQIVFQRSATEEEHLRATTFLTEASRQLNNLPASERRAAAWQALSRVLLATNEFVYLD